MDDHVSRCGSTYRLGGSKWLVCAKRHHEQGLHVSIGSDPVFWWASDEHGQHEATTAELTAELALLGRCDIRADDPRDCAACRRAWAYCRCDGGPQAMTLNGRADQPPPKQTAAMAREQGFTGEACGGCGSMRVVRNGSCLLCRSCGQTSGCS